MQAASGMPDAPPQAEIDAAMTDSNVEVMVGAAWDNEPFRLRSYQDEMLEETLKRNSIVVLETGAGKTHVAIARMRAELESCGEDKLVWFLAPTVALCRQHSISLQTHLPSYQIRVLSGEDEVERWTEQALWNAVLKNIRIVISTPAILLEALTHGFVKLARLSLCVFDEAHHCKDRHPYNLIMRQFYHPAKANGASVPHVLGLSASPVMKAKAGGLELLEANLNSHVITPKLQRLELMRYVHVPKLIKCTYQASSIEELGAHSSLYRAFWRELQNYNLETDPYIVELRSSSDPAAATKLAQLKLTRKTYCLTQLKGLSIRVEVILQDIGPAALQWYFQMCWQRMNKGLEQPGACWLPELAEKEKRRLADILNSVVTPSDAPVEVAGALASKTQLLLEILKCEAGPSFTGIVFAEQRSVVATLAAIISTHPMTAGLFNVGTFVGSSSSSSRKSNIGDIVELTGQQQNLDDFRVGKKNLIIATSVLEEGIDVSSCQTILCFDPPSNLTSFVQRRGRARKKGSKFIVLLKDGDNKGDRRYDLEEKMKAAYLNDLRNSQLAAELEEQADFGDLHYSIETTGALLTSDNAKAHLYHFCATLLRRGYAELKPTFSCKEDVTTKLVTAEVMLPSAVHTSVRVAKSSHPFKTERAAMADAAFHAYIALHRNGLVNDNLLPLRTKVTDVVGEIQSRPSLVQVLPRLDPWSLLQKHHSGWSKNLVEVEIGGKREGSLWMYLLADCPPIYNIPIFWNGNTKGVVRISKHHMGLAQPDIMNLADQTLTLLSAVFPPSRIDSNMKDFMVLFEPHNYQARQEVVPTLGLFVNKKGKIEPQDYGLLRYLGRAYVFEELVSTSPTFMVRVRRFPKKRDFLRCSDAAASLKDTPVVELPLANCTMDILPARYAFAAACVPSILHCIENAILAQELQRNLLATIEISNLDLIIEATTSSSASSEKNFERLEFLGDSVLKYCTHINLVAQHPTWPEGYLTEDKGRTNGNASLAKAALKTGLDRFISTKCFTTNHWKPPYQSELFSRTEQKVERSTKTLADVVESLIGASFLSKGLEGALNCIRVFLPDEQWLRLDQAHDMLQDATPTGKTCSAILLEEILGYHFNNPTLLIEATTHVSYKSSDSTLSYERLEFLGDAVLDQIVVPEIFRRQPPLKNHEMHRLRQAVANAHILGFLCMELNLEQGRMDVAQNTEAMSENTVFDLVPSSHTFHLQDFLRCGPAIATQRKAAITKHGELCEQISQELRHGTEYPWPLLLELQPPKVFCDMVEALLGAIYIDSHGSLAKCQAFLERLGLMDHLHRLLIENDVNLEHPKIRLGILAGTANVSYSTIQSAANSDANRLYECTVKLGGRDILMVGGCTSRDEAECRAAWQAVKALERTRRESEGTTTGT